MITKTYHFKSWSIHGNEPVESVLDIDYQKNKLTRIICTTKYQDGNYKVLPLVAKVTSPDCFLANQDVMHSDVLLRLIGIRAIESTGKSDIIDKKHFCKYKLILL